MMEIYSRVCFLLYLYVSVSSGFKVFKIIAATGRILTGNIIANLPMVHPNCTLGRGCR